MKKLLLILLILFLPVSIQAGDIGTLQVSNSITLTSGYFFTNGSSTQPVGAVYGTAGYLFTTPHIVALSGTLVNGTITWTLSGNAAFSNAYSYYCTLNFDITAGKKAPQGSGLAITYTSGSSLQATSMTGATYDVKDVSVVRGICVGE
jgi:hypothetical protein